MSQSEIQVRRATPADLRAVLDLVIELAVYEKAPDAVTATLATYEEAFDHGAFDCVVAQAGNEIVGMALYYPRFSTWKGPMLYLEDFVVSEKHRGKGIGKKLFEAYIDAAAQGNYALCMWQVLDWNEPAISFYKNYPVEFSREWLNVKLEL